MNLVPHHALEPHPNVGLDVLHDVTNVKVAIGVGQCGGDENAALAHGVQSFLNEAKILEHVSAGPLRTASAALQARALGASIQCMAMV